MGGTGLSRRNNKGGADLIQRALRVRCAWNSWLVQLAARLWDSGFRFWLGLTPALPGALLSAGRARLSHQQGGMEKTVLGPLHPLWYHQGHLLGSLVS